MISMLTYRRTPFPRTAPAPSNTARVSESIAVRLLPSGRAVGAQRPQLRCLPTASSRTSTVMTGAPIAHPSTAGRPDRPLRVSGNFPAVRLGATSRTENQGPMGAPRLHVQILNGADQFQHDLAVVRHPDSDGGEAVTLTELHDVEVSFETNVLPMLTVAADTLRFIQTAASAGAESPWLARQMHEHLLDLETISPKRFFQAHQDAKVLFLDHYRQGPDPEAA